MEEDLKQLMRQNYLKYASYVILDRAIPSVVDGLKPVQRRILHTLYNMHDGKMHKVANVAGQTMAYHPHGDAPITEALVTMANKGFMLDTQGNFGNIYTGDPAAAARYIETRLSILAMETMFNPQLTTYLPSYDGRNKEPVDLPAKIPLVLMQGISGIAVGMSTNILSHNFVEVLEAEIAILEERPFKVLPDFATGGIMDASEYDEGRGKIKLRAKIEVRDPKTLAITEVCFGTTTESVIRSIDEAAKRGKIKIEAIHDYTADKVEIEIKLPRGHYAQDLIDALYAYTDCEVTIHSQILVIKDNLPWLATVSEILHFHVEALQGYLKRELEIEREGISEKIFNKTLEQIFIENRLYKKIENVASYDKIHDTVAQSLEPFHEQLIRIPNEADRERLLNIPIRRISRFDIDKNQEEIAALQQDLKKIEKELKNIQKFTIEYLRGLLKKHGKEFPRRTQIQQIEEIDKRAIATVSVKIGVDLVGGFVGTKVVSDQKIECTNYDKLLLMYQDGSYKVVNIPEKLYIHSSKSKVISVSVADKQTVFNVVYKDPETHVAFAKRFIIKHFILDKDYRFFEEGMKLELLTSASAPTVDVLFIPKIGQKISKTTFSFEKALIKGVTARGMRIATRGVKKVHCIEK